MVRKKEAHTEDADEGTPSPPPKDPFSDMLNTILTKLQDLRVYMLESDLMQWKPAYQIWRLISTPFTINLIL